MAVNKSGVYKAFTNDGVFEIITMAGGLTSEADETDSNQNENELHTI